MRTDPITPATGSSYSQPNEPVEAALRRQTPAGGTAHEGLRRPPRAAGSPSADSSATSRRQPPLEELVPFNLLPQNLVDRLAELTIDPVHPKAAALQLAALGATNKTLRVAVQSQLPVLPEVGRITTGQRLQQAVREASREMAQLGAEVPYAVQLASVRHRIAAVIKNLPDVTVDLRHMAPPISTEIVAVLKDHPELKKLDINLPHNAHDMEAVLDLLTQRPGVLRSLDMQSLPGHSRGPYPARLAQVLQAQAGLEELNLSYVQLPLEGLRPVLEAVATQTQLRTLSLSGWPMCYTDSKALFDALKQLPGLQRLDLAGRGLRTEYVVAALLPNAQLRHLDLGRNGLGDACVRTLAPLLARLESLMLEDSHISRAGGQSLALHLRAGGSLQRLGLACNQLGDTAADVCFALQGHPALQDLDLGKNGIGSANMAHLAKALARMPTLQALNLQGNDLGNRYRDDRGFVALAQALTQLPELKRLNLDRTGLHTAGIKALESALQGLVGMEHLALSGNALGDEAATLGAVLKAMPGLHTLELQRIGLTPISLASLTDGLEHGTALRNLNLSDNSLGSEGLQALVPVLRRMPHLQQLNLNGTKLRLSDMKVLIPTLRDAQHLQQLDVLSNNVIDKGALQRQLQRPELHVR